MFFTLGKDSLRTSLKYKNYELGRNSNSEKYCDTPDQVDMSRELTELRNVSLYLIQFTCASVLIQFCQNPPSSEPVNSNIWLNGIQVNRQAAPEQ